MNQEELALLKIANRFSTEEAAREYFERIRWPNGPVCPHCGNGGRRRIYRIGANPEKKIRSGLCKCAECGRQFTVTVGTICEDSHIPLHKWLVAFYMMCASKAQLSALQLQRQLELGSYRTALSLRRRIRYALKDNLPGGKLENTVEAHEAFWGGSVRSCGNRYDANKIGVVAPVERGGCVRSRAVHQLTKEALSTLIDGHIIETTSMNIDESSLFEEAGKESACHDTANCSAQGCVPHNCEIGRTATTNTIERSIGNNKLAIDGIRHNIFDKYLCFKLAEFDDKHNTRKTSNGTRTIDGIRNIEGERLMLRCPIQKERRE